MEGESGTCHIFTRFIGLGLCTLPVPLRAHRVQKEEDGYPYRDGDTVFQNPVEPATYFGQKTNLAFTAQPGTILLFPGYLRHMVIPHEDDERITFAFNIDHVKKITAPQKVIPEEEQRRTVNVILDQPS